MTQYNLKQDNVAIAARKLKLSLGDAESKVDILKGVDLEILRGQSIALLGPSGSGKSSLMAILSGLERASSGTVIVDGTEFTSLNEDELSLARRGRIGIILQAFHLLPTMTALENVMVPMELAGVDGYEEKARQELAAVGLSHRVTHYPTQLSGGEQQRVAIARATAGAPAILFADEPTGNLDGETGANIIKLLFDRQKAIGATLLMITHDPSLAQKCDRVLRMADGMLSEDSL
ncbi:ABC transporter [Sphingorhabdus lutea]|uniref:ABC transporter n=1 Tax=Sphingorhabdus lutea TaxID=1913578 RepID=A0A1L3JDJ6_9SPHN|nr:ATP-binding cassette domain-containing protein [Sphingorhabdus lutea]APG63179.1 ABC transporter [Sphingorhabdus lutea]